MAKFAKLWHTVAMKRKIRHIPVLLESVLHVLHPQPGQVFVDCTLGLGGHSSFILKKITPGGRLIAIDFDQGNIDLARRRLEAIPGGQFDLYHNNFAALAQVLAQAGVSQIDGLLADVGVASPQIDDPERGFSYKKPGPLDMRMDISRGQPASALINRMGQEEMAHAFLEYGDETDAPQIAEAIVARRKIKPIETTQELMAIVCQARDFTLQRAAGAKLHPAARTFQALRIMVNRELSNLENLLRIMPGYLKPGATAAIISFHSGEDRRVKHSLKDGLKNGTYSAISEEPIIACEDEKLTNPRSRSAKLRWARKNAS